MNYQLFPYDGKGNVRDSDWGYIWNKIEEQGLVDLVFCNDGVTSAYEFIALMKKSMPTIVMDMDRTEPVAVAWLADLMPNFGFAHFVFFKEIWGTGEPHNIGMDILDFWFNTLNMKLILGVIPEFNKHAIKYADGLGMVMMDTIPHLVMVKGEDSPGVLGYLTKEMFNG